MFARSCMTIRRENYSGSLRSLSFMKSLVSVLTQKKEFQFQRKFNYKGKLDFSLEYLLVIISPLKNKKCSWFWSMWIFIEMYILPLGCWKYLFMNESRYIHDAWHLLQLDIYSLCFLNSSPEIMENTVFPFLFMCICRWITCKKCIIGSCPYSAALAIVASIKNVMNGKLVDTLYINVSIFLALNITFSNWILFTTEEILFV